MEKVYTHPKLEGYVKHSHGIVYIECDLLGNVLKLRRDWQIGATPRPQYRIITDKSKLTEV